MSVTPHVYQFLMCIYFCIMLKHTKYQHLETRKGLLVYNLRESFADLLYEF